MPDQTKVTLTHYRDLVQACAVMNFRQVSPSVTARFGTQLRPAGLRGTQPNLLMAIATTAAPTFTAPTQSPSTVPTALTRILHCPRSPPLAATRCVAVVVWRWDARSSQVLFPLTGAGSLSSSSGALWSATARKTRQSSPSCPSCPSTTPVPSGQSPVSYHCSSDQPPSPTA